MVESGLKIFVEVYSTIVQRTPTALERVLSICEAPKMRSLSTRMNHARFTHIWPELAICSTSSAARGERWLGASVSILAAAALRASIAFDKSAIQRRQTQPSVGRLSVCAPSGDGTQRRRRWPTWRPVHFGRVSGMPQGRSARQSKPRVARQRQRRASTFCTKVTPVRR